MSEKLGLFQRIYKAMVSEQRFLEVRAQTKKWKAECKRCSRVFSAWDVGGVFWRDPDENGTLIKCPHCGRRSITWLERKRD